MELNREKIVKALECCSADDCDNCPNTFGNCYANLAGYALAIIRELTEEKERLNDVLMETEMPFEQALDRTKWLEKENERLEKEVDRLSQVVLHHNEITEMEVAEAKADTLSDMQTRFAMHFGTYTKDATIKVSDVFKLLERFKEEIMEGTDERIDT